MPGADWPPRLEHLRGRDLVVLGLPRGGVPVAYEVAKALDAPLDVVVIRKLGAPFNSEFAIGAIGEGVRVVDEAALRQLGITDGQLVEIETREEAELQRRILRFRGSAERLDLAGRVAVIVDDGIATGSTALAACRVVRALGRERGRAGRAGRSAGLDRPFRQRRGRIRLLWRRRAPSSPSGSGTPTSPRPPTTR